MTKTFLIKQNNTNLLNKNISNINIYEYSNMIEFNFKEKINYKELSDFILDYYIEDYFKPKISKFIKLNEFLDIYDSIYLSKLIKNDDILKTLNIHNISYNKDLINILKDLTKSNTNILDINGIITFRNEIFLEFINSIINFYINKYLCNNNYTQIQKNK